MRVIYILREVVIKNLRFLLNINFENLASFLFLVAACRHIHTCLANKNKSHRLQMAECNIYYCWSHCHNKAFIATNRVTFSFSHACSNPYFSGKQASPHIQLISCNG